MHAAQGSGRLVAGRYRLGGPIGRGAMGIVWFGRDELLDRDVAIKQVQITSLASPAEAEVIYQRTLREARTAAKLSHPSVVTVFDVVEENGSPWIVMELVRARSLDQVIAEDGPLPPLEAAQAGESLLGALASAHAAGVLHRDVKPSNVLVTSDGQAVLTDFGIATFAGDPALTQAGMVVGTPGFTAPERLAGQQASPASDLWSLGATLYAAVEGRGPFDRPGGAVMVMDGIMNEDAPRAPSAGPLGPVIAALLRSDPAERPDSATAAGLLADATSRARTGQPPPFGARIGPLAGGAASASASGTVPTPVRAATAPSARAEADGAAPGTAADGAGTSGTPAADPEASGTQAADAGASSTQAADAGTSSTQAADAGTSGPARAEAQGSGPEASGAEAADAAAFMETPAFAELRMPDLDSPELPGQASLPASVELPAFLDAARFAGPSGLPPDPAVPWDPASPAANWDPLDPLSQPDSPAHPAGNAAGPSAAQPGRRGRMIAAVAAAVLAMSVVAAWLAYSHHGGSTAQAQSLGQSPAPVTAGQAGPAGAQHSGSGRSGAGSSAPGPAAGAPGTISKPQPVVGSTGKPGRPAKPGGTAPASPSAAPSPSTPVSPSPSPSPSTGGGSGGGPPPPAGYRWHRITAASAGSTAGFRIALPIAWQTTAEGLQTYFQPLVGSAYIEADLTPFTYPKPVREADYLQAQAKKDGTYRQYGLVAIDSTTFRGVPEATWRFHWQELGVGKIAVLQALFTLSTSAGKQPYALSVSVPAGNFTAVDAIFHKALQTFKPLP